MSEGSWEIAPRMGKLRLHQAVRLGSAVALGRIVGTLLTEQPWRDQESLTLAIALVAFAFVCSFAVTWILGGVFSDRDRRLLTIKITPESITGPHWSLFRYERVKIAHSAICEKAFRDQTWVDWFVGQQILASQDGKTIMLWEAAYDRQALRQILKWSGRETISKQSAA